MNISWSRAAWMLAMLLIRCVAYEVLFIITFLTIIIVLYVVLAELRRMFQVDNVVIKTLTMVAKTQDRDTVIKIFIRYPFLFVMGIIMNMIVPIAAMKVTVEKNS